MRKQQNKLKVALHKAAREAAYKAALAVQQRSLEANFKGIGGIQNQVNVIAVLIMWRGENCF